MSFTVLSLSPAPHSLMPRDTGILAVVSFTCEVEDQPFPLGPRLIAQCTMHSIPVGHRVLNRCTHLVDRQVECNVPYINHFLPIQDLFFFRRWGPSLYCNLKFPPFSAPCFVHPSLISYHSDVRRATTQATDSNERRSKQEGRHAR